jgi:hypothetical protein
MKSFVDGRRAYIMLDSLTFDSKSLPSFGCYFVLLSPEATIFQVYPIVLCVFCYNLTKFCQYELINIKIINKINK